MSANSANEAPLSMVTAGIPVPVPTDRILAILERYVKTRTKRLDIRNIHLNHPTLLSPGDVDYDTSHYPIEFGLSFRIKNKETKPIESCLFAIVFEFNSPDETSNTVTKNYSSELNEFDGLIEPQIAPINIQTDFEEYIKISEDYGSKSGFEFLVDIYEQVDIRIKVGSSDITGDEVKTTVQSLLNAWIMDCSGMDVRRFADPSIKNLDEIPARVVGDEILM